MKSALVSILYSGLVSTSTTRASREAAAPPDEHVCNSSRLIRKLRSSPFSSFVTSLRAVLHRHVLDGAPQNLSGELALVLDVLLALAFLDAVERRLRDKHVAARDQLLHVPEEERQQQRADVRAIHVGVRHDDDLVVAQPGDVEIVLADAGADRRDHGPDFFVAEHLVVARLLDVEDLSPQRKDRLIAPVAAALGGSAGRFALDQVHLATLRILLLAIGQLAGQTAGIERALAPRQIASFAGRFARARRFDRLADDALHHRRDSYRSTRRACRSRTA